MVAFRNAYERSSKPGITFEKPSLTQQHFKDECDINLIIKRFTKNDLALMAMMSDMQYGDYSTPVDFHEAMNIVIRAQEQFEALPSSVRDKFDNDPAKMLDFVSKKENIEESVKLGLLNREALQIIQASGASSGSNGSNSNDNLHVDDSAKVENKNEN